MKRSVLFAILIVCTATMVFAQAGSVGVFSDAAGTDCNISSSLYTRVYYYHLNHTGATAAQFKLNLNGYTGWDLVGDTFVFDTVIGSSTTGVSLGYGSCLSAPTYLGRTTFELLGADPPACLLINIVPDPGVTSGQIEMVDCSATKYFPTGGAAYVDGDGSCDCNVPVEETTWGGIKALY